MSNEVEEIRYLGFGVYGSSLVDEDLSNIDFILLGGQVERSQTGLRTDS